MKDKVLALVKNPKTWAWLFAALAADGQILGGNVSEILVAVAKAVVATMGGAL